MITRGGVRFGLFGLIGIDAQKYAVNPGATRFDDPIVTARTIVRQLKDVERVDVVICLSHVLPERRMKGLPYECHCR